MPATDHTTPEHPMTSPSLPEIARTAAVLKTLKDAVAEADAAHRAVVTAALETAAAELGVSSIAARVGDTEVAKISLVKSKPRAVVTNPVALVAWAEEHHPAAIIRTLNPAWEKAMLAAATKAGAAVDVDTGELIPGVEIVDSGATTHRVTMAKAGRAVIADAWRRGELADVVTRALMPGGGD